MEQTILLNPSLPTSNKPIDTEEIIRQMKAERRTFYFSNGLPEKYEKPETIVVTGKGIGRIVKNRIGTMGNLVSKFSVLGLPDDPFPVFELGLPKIPMETLSLIYSFFAHVCENHNNAEAYALIYFNRETNLYEIGIPEQSVSGGSVITDRKVEEKFQKGMAEGKYYLVMDIHSHNSMNAFFSSVDDNDEKDYRLYGVIGRVNTNPEIKLRAGGSLLDIPLKVEDLFEGEKVFHRLDFPEEWKEKISKRLMAEHKTYTWDEHQLVLDLGGSDRRVPPKHTSSFNPSWHSRNIPKDYGKEDWDKDSYCKGPGINRIITYQSYLQAKQKDQERIHKGVEGWETDVFKNLLEQHGHQFIIDNMEADEIDEMICDYLESYEDKGKSVFQHIAFNVGLTNVEVDD